MAMVGGHKPPKPPPFWPGNGGPAEVGEAAGKGGASCLNGCF